MAVPFDATRQQLLASPVSVLDGVRRRFASATLAVAQFSISDTGLLAYLPGPAGLVSARQNRLVMVTLHGGTSPLPTSEGPYEFPRFSPDGAHLAFDTDDGKEANVWVYDVSGASAMRRLTFGGRNRHPIWSRDGQSITFQSDREGDLGLFRQRADGTGPAERLTKADQATSHVPQSWSSDGEQLLFTVNSGGILEARSGTQNPGSRSALMLLSLKDRTTGPFTGVESNGRPVDAELSPDGAWVAYSAGDNPTVVYIQPFPPTGAVYQVSKGDDGHLPWWSHDGHELFYVPGPDGLVRVSVNTHPSVSFGSPSPLPRGALIESPVTSRNMDITPDGKRIVGVTSADQNVSGNTNPREIELVLNWFEELRARVPRK